MQDKFQIGRMRSFFEEGSTRDLAFRMEQLRRLSRALEGEEPRLHEALYADLHKSPAEAYAAETGLLQREIRHALKHLRGWSRPRRAAVPLGLHPASARVFPEPKGVVLIIGPWNYPVQLMLSPLIAAISAGNCALLKPSELTPNSSAALRELIRKTFDPDYVQLVEGGRETAEDLLSQPFDHLFFTGGTVAGRAAAKAAAAQLMPATLELGGKSPAVVCEDSRLDTAARRIARGKFMNAGQTCVAPDYVWVPRSCLAVFCRTLEQCIAEFYGPDPRQSPDYGRIVNRRHLERLQALCPECVCDPGELYIAPTVIADPPPESALLHEEIFGPLLAVLPYDSDEEVIEFCKARPVPLALYLFTDDRRQQKRLMEAIPSGGVCINDTVSQLIPDELPFGGRGQSGMGAYHGRAGFDELSHFRSVLRRSIRFDCRALYPPLTIPLRRLKKAYRLFFG